MVRCASVCDIWGCASNATQRGLACDVLRVTEALRRGSRRGSLTLATLALARSRRAHESELDSGELMGSDEPMLSILTGAS